MKVALVIHGMIGGMKGKNYQNLGGGDKVLQLAYEHNKKYILNKYDTDVFVHSWTVKLKDEIETLYKPKKSLIEEQIQFEVPAYMIAPKDRAFAHISRWYSFHQAVNLQSEYATENDIKYDHVIVQRFDLTWNKSPEFENMDPQYFWVGDSRLNKNREWSDRWFCTNPLDMKRFSELGLYWDEYMGHDGSLPSVRQWSGISSHFLVRHHAKKLGLIERFKHNFGEIWTDTQDYSEVRRQYSEDKK